MPGWESMLVRGSDRLSRDRVDKIQLKRLAAVESLPDLAEALGVARTPEELAHIESWPRAIQEAIRAAVMSAVDRDERVPVSLSWAPDYDYSVTVWETRATRGKSGGINIQLRGPYEAAERATAKARSTRR